MSKRPTHKEMLNASGSGIIGTDEMGNIIFVNTHAREILGLDPEESAGTPISEIIPSIGSLVKRCLNTGKGQMGHHIMNEDPELIVNIIGIRGDGQIHGVLCTFRRIRDFEGMANKLESYYRLNKQWNVIFKSSSDGILVSDSKGNILNMNEASEALNGMKAGDVIGKNVADFVKSGLFDQSVTMEVLDTKRQVSIMQYIKKTKKYLLVTGTPAFDEEGNIFLVVVNERDMTQLNAMREQLEESRMYTEKVKDELTELSILEMTEQEIFAESEVMKQVLKTGLKLAKLEASNILILGESGTGKGLLAKFIHNNSKRKNKPFIQINCAALPEGLLEAELFGYEKGAFTGAREKGKVGLFELAQEGTLFLDEIGDLPISVQAKLLKYLDDNEILRLGGVKPIKVDCTIIAATNRNLESLTRARAFRKDLFYRLNNFPLHIPPLRVRPEDTFRLVVHFLEKYSRTYGFTRRISPKVLGMLQGYPFPGNVRELKNLIKKAVVMGDKEVLDNFILESLNLENDHRKTGTFEGKGQLSLNNEILAIERDILMHAARKCKSTREMAGYLSVSQPTVVRKLKKHRLTIPSIHK